LTWNYSGPLVYVELFKSFSYTASPFLCLNQVSASFSPAGKHESAVSLVTNLTLACHIAPQFSVLEEKGTLLMLQIDLLDVLHRFFYNPYYDYYSYLLAEHWWKHQARASGKKY
jgi:hypothetical protein